MKEQKRTIKRAKRSRTGAIFKFQMKILKWDPKSLLISKMISPLYDFAKIKDYLNAKIFFSNENCLINVN